MKYYGDEASMADFIETAQRKLPDVDPASVARIVRQALRMAEHDDHRLGIFIMALELLDRGIQADDVIEILAKTKTDLIAQRLAEGHPHPDGQV